MRFNTLLLGTLAASAIATDHTVTIGGDNLDQYSPAEIKAEKGDTITFQRTCHTLTYPPSSPIL